MEEKITEKKENTIEKVELSHLEGACLYLRRAIVNLPASPVKEKLLFHIDHVVCLDIYSDFDEVKNKIEIIDSIIQQENVTNETRQNIAYLNDLFKKARNQNIKIADLDKR